MGKSGVRHMGEMGEWAKLKKTQIKKVRYGKKWGATYGRNGRVGEDTYLGDHRALAVVRDGAPAEEAFGEVLLVILLEDVLHTETRAHKKE